ncbi:actin-like ATPase domain-containing protein [Polyplosphaeria fusca]|uniref:Actin-like ATPase domain-containing protein n=1 Tax=Polyplosphaeria fusca TaxID=682080 RepID=A0A9P4R2N4_9PLEO|nr:actin-like ATPase domain-containing protein [Polyplosphaeria fusca]
MAPPGRRRFSPSPFTIILGLLFLFSTTASAASGVLGIDLGTEYIKAALVKPGIPLEIVLTKDSKRKELSAVAFKPSKAALPAGSFPERLYGGDAVALQARFPGDVFPNLKQLLGVTPESDAVKVYNERYPAVKVEGTEGRPTVSVNSGIFAEGEKTFTVEELLAMELQNIRDNAKALAGKGVDIQDVVFTVPPFYTADERRALEASAKLAGLKVLGMVSDGMAVGIHYATSRTFPTVNEGGKPETHLVFDMGAGSASATVLRFQGRKVKDVGKYNKTIQEVQVLGAGWDRTLGGDALNTLIVDDMIKSFVALPAAKSAAITADQVKAHGRTAAKLFKEAEKVRQVLSANTQTSAFFEGLYEDVDFRYKLSRTQLEDLATEHANRVQAPIKQALDAAGLTIDDIDSVIVHGGATRTPFVQAQLEAFAGKAKIKTNVNSDEAAVFGAAFKAAGISPSFRVKEIRDSDTQGFPLGIQYQFNLKDRDQKIFTPTSKIGATKDLPFQMMGEFEFSIYEARPGAGDETTKAPVLDFKSGNLTRVVTQMIDGDGCDRDTFNNYVQVRLSPVTGTPEVTSAWVTCEAEVEEKKGGVVEGVKNFFGMGDKKDQEVLRDDESSPESSEAASDSSAAPSASSSAEPESSESATGKKKKQQVKSANTFHVTQKGYEKHPRKEFKKMQDRLLAFDSSDRSRRIREESLNNLEAFTYRARDLLEDESFVTASTSAERSLLEEKLSAASDWIYSEGHDATEEVLKSKLKELKDIVDPVNKRKTESGNRPELIKEIRGAIADLKSVIPMMKENIEAAIIAKSAEEEASKSSAAAESATTADPLDDLEEDELLKSSTTTQAPMHTAEAIYTEEDIKAIEDTIEESTKWMDEKEAAQKKLKENEDPAVTVKELNAKKKELDDGLTRVMTKRMQSFQRQQNQQKSKSKSESKKSKSKTKKSKKTSSTSADEAAATPSSPTEAEMKAAQEALEKAGIKGAKLEQMGFQKEIMDKDGKPLVRLDLPEDASEDDIKAAIDRAINEGKRMKADDDKKKAKEKKEKKEHEDKAARTTDKDEL